MDPAQPPEPAPATPPRRPLSVGRLATAGVLLAAAIVLPLVVNIYAADKPRLWGFPFFFWYQLLWVFIASACTYGAYLIIERGRR